MRNLITIAFAITIFAFTTSSSANSDNKSPEFAVKKLLGEIKQIVKKDNLSDTEKAENKKHSDIALSVLKVPEISKKALGKYWSKHNAEQQQKFQTLLGDLFVHVAFPSSAKFLLLELHSHPNHEVCNIYPTSHQVVQLCFWKHLLLIPLP